MSGAMRRSTVLSVAALRARHHDDLAHSDHVCAQAVALFIGTLEAHGMSPLYLPLLQTGALVHNVGLEENQARHHTIGRDIVMAEGLRGFTPEETRVIACLVAFHRKTVRPEQEPLWRELAPDLQQVTLRLAAILRVADGLDWNYSQTSQVAWVRGRRRPRIYVRGAAKFIAQDVDRAIEKTDLWDAAMGRAPRIVATAKPARPWRPAAKPGQTLGTSAGIILRGYLAQAIVWRDQVGLFDGIDARHDMRVALRRFRFTLRLYRRIWTPEAYDALRAEVGWFGGLLGAVRDADLMLRWLQEARDEAPAALQPRLDAICHDTARRQRAALKRLVTELRGPRVDALLRQAGAWAQGENVAMRAPGRAEDLLAQEVPRRLRRQARRVFEGWGKGIGETEVERLHLLRIRCRQMRYAAEGWQEALGGGRGQLARALLAVQDALGDMHDADVRAAPWAGLPDQEVATWLRERCAADRALAWPSFQKAWPKLVRCLAPRRLNRVVGRR